LGQGIARKPDEAQSQTVDDRLSRFAVDGHPNRARVCRNSGGIWDRLLPYVRQCSRRRVG
jgi:hypothetical protein